MTERLPPDLADQVLETILGHFAIHSVTAASLYDVPAIAEATWHGACLACAEMTRRGVVSPERLPELVDWLSKVWFVLEVKTLLIVVSRHYTLTCAKAHIPLVLMFVMQVRMCCGR